MISDSRNSRPTNDPGSDTGSGPGADGSHRGEEGSASLGPKTRGTVLLRRLRRSPGADDPRVTTSLLVLVGVLGPTRPSLRGRRPCKSPPDPFTRVSRRGRLRLGSSFSGRRSSRGDPSPNRVLWSEGEVKGWKAYCLTQSLLTFLSGLRVSAFLQPHDGGRAPPVSFPARARRWSTATTALLSPGPAPAWAAGLRRRRGPEGPGVAGVLSETRSGIYVVNTGLVFQDKVSNERL